MPPAYVYDIKFYDSRSGCTDLIRRMLLIKISLYLCLFQAFAPYWNGCVAGLRELGDDTANDECFDNFSEDEQLAATASGMVIGRYECFRAYLQTLCLGAWAAGV